MKKAKLALMEDMTAASFDITCKSGHEFKKTGKWLRENLIFGCPKCGCTIVHTHADIDKLFDDRIQLLHRLADQGKISVFKP
ncbi:hypothetical protein [Mesorhizobium muleiense]|uniref:hypothetical protein n=1 Tax=Mesorhizobium muleiense TaxID=1004279 RepID=UPI001F33B2CB|nr:hypothetical protein [Mesorhizobium muleiense]MCF6112372.1 hypothetical protein [Mesorhizobium muleiense]